MDESSSQPQHTIEIVVRFSNVNPDIILIVTSLARLTGLSLKQLIRAELEAPTSESRLRLIHSGKVINDTTALSRTLTPIFPPPISSSFTPDAADKTSSLKSEKAQGKQPLRDAAVPAPAPRARVYVHCAVGDALSGADLAAEAKKAQEAEAALVDVSSQPSKNLGDDATEDKSSLGASSTTPAPRGFDRLLSAGFTPTEVAALRAQFLAIQAHSHTPDTMPTGAELLGLEERWLDNGANGAAGGGQDAGGFGGDDTGGLEDMLYGNLIGFFWPIGAMCWLMREEGVWSRRRQIAVLSGLLVNLTFGWLSVMS